MTGLFLLGCVSCDLTWPHLTSPGLILFQRGSVITTDIVPALGTELCWWKSSRLYRPSTAARPQGGVQAAGGQAPPPLPRGAHGHLHHHLRRHVPGSSEKYFVIHKNLFKLFSCSPGPDKRTRALATGERVRHSPHPPHLLFNK